MYKLLKIENKMYYILDDTDNTIDAITKADAIYYTKKVGIEGLSINKKMVSYNFRLYPNKKQREQIDRTIGCTRKIYNLMLEDRINQYKTTGKVKRYYPKHFKDMSEYSYLNLVDSLALSGAWNDLNDAYNNFFNNGKGFPRFKSKKYSTQSYRTQNQKGKKVIFENKIKIPILGLVRARITRDIDSTKVKSMTITKTPTGKYFISFPIETEVLVDSLNELNSLGVDLGLKYLLVDSNGKKYPNNKYYSKYQRKLARAQRKLSRRKTGSSNYNKQKQRVALIHEKIANSRRDNINKVTTEIIKDNQLIVSEDLNIKGLLKNPRLAKAIQDASWGEICRQFKYKSDWYNRTYRQVDRFYPSSQTCSNCQQINPKIKDLRIREWTCPACGAYHDRDINAAINILRHGQSASAQAS